MQLPFFPKNNSPVTTREYLLALEVSPGIVKSAVWSVINGQTQVISIGSAGNWQSEDLPSLISAVDATVSEASQRVDESGKIVINKVILGLPALWVKDDKIEPDKMIWVRQISEKLGLTPVGFVVTFEAVIRYVQRKEGVPLTAITLGFWPNSLEMSLVRLGKIEGSVTVARSQNLTDDVVEGLSRFPSVEMLPSRMLLYDSGIDLEEVKQLLLTYPWLSPSRKFGFLHFPKVEILPADFTIRAIALSGGTEVAVSLGMMEKPASPVLVQSQELTAADFGFSSKASIPAPEVIPVMEIAETVITPEAVPESKSKFVLPKISLPNFHPNLHLPRINFGRGLNILALLLIGVGIIVFGWAVPKAKVSLEFQSKLINHNFLTELATQSVEANSSQEQSATTSGTKVVGDKATGSVTIVNSTASAKSFSKGAAITSPSGLKFVLDKDVQVASASGLAKNKILGKSSVNVTAAQVGAESNLSAGTDFQIGSLATFDVVATNEIAFSGGSSRQVKAVAKVDAETLRDQIFDKAKMIARQQLIDKTTGQTLISDSITYLVMSEDLDPKIGDSADTVNLKLTVRAKGIVVTKADLDQATAVETNPLIPVGFTLQSVETNNLSIKKTKGDTSQISISAIVKIIPRIDNQEVVKTIAGKSLEKAREYLRTLPGINKIDISISPSLPIITSRLPFRSGRIEVLVHSP